MALKECLCSILTTPETYVVGREILLMQVVCWLPHLRYGTWTYTHKYTNIYTYTHICTDMQTQSYTTEV